MYSVLIVEPSEVLRTTLAEELQKKFQVFCCEDGSTGLNILKKETPDSLIFNLFLPGMDGLQFLESAGSLRPRVIISLSAAYPPYILQTLKDLGVGYYSLLPCTIPGIVYRLNDMLNTHDPSISSDQQSVIAKHLRVLGVPYWSGYHMLRVGVPLFAQDRTQSLTKEYYPAVAILCACDNWQQVESAIRSAKEYAWEHRNDDVWRQYFSDTSQCPTNRDFIYRLSEILDK